MLIMKAEEADLEEILELQRKAFVVEAVIYNDYTIQPLRQTIEDLKSEYETQTLLKAVVEENRIAGSVRAFFNGDTCYIGRLIVHPDFQNKGIGTSLLCEAEQMFKECRRFELFTGHLSKKNLYLYGKKGYKIFKSQVINEKLTMMYLEKMNGFGS
ncbi:GNAT family N-acetyltransferase [Paenibacillus sp. 7124]|uniref:GNAT family N-acetyltransferase n=1 Tax=Paenibacillus apii TaxID=1850370 RepID=A0A6M1PJL9_9BACL|nr:GNAT family N-acetyltransferase [Paenibacillus apii]NGM83767.1 GNAT family N-acetyltransferase [Paenibacillus apii]NJJ41128.1 GNAT family N-acetyltransferase [Paenibacillus apii]